VIAESAPIRKDPSSSLNSMAETLSGIFAEGVTE